MLPLVSVFSKFRLYHSLVSTLRLLQSENGVQNSLSMKDTKQKKIIIFIM